MDYIQDGSFGSLLAGLSNPISVCRVPDKRAAASVPLNLAEGRGRASKTDQKRFFSIAMGSVRESQAILIIANMENSSLYSLLDKLAASLYKLIKNWG